MKWTWTRVVLLIAAVWLQVDAFKTPSRADPGPAGDVSLSFAISWVALKKKVPPTSEAILGLGLTVFACASNRAASPSDKLLWLPLVILACVLFVYFGRGE